MKLCGEDLLELEKANTVAEDSVRKAKFERVIIDSRICRKGDLFFAIKGERFDGHNFIADVLKKGAEAVVAEKKWYRKLTQSKKRSFNKANIVLIESTVKSLGELARNYRRKFLIPVIAIGGSNGKTGTKDIIAHVLAAKYSVLKTEGNMNNSLGVPLTLFSLKDEHQICVIEVGTNHFGEIDYLCRVAEPQFGVLTNIGKEHLEFLKDIRGTAKAEGELVDYLELNCGTFFLNSDDKYISSMRRNRSLNVFSYGSKGSPDVKGRVKNYSMYYPEIGIKFGKKNIDAKLKTIGSQAFYSALPAAAIGYFFDVPLSRIKSALASHEVETPGRNQLRESGSIRIIDDTYNSNPDSVKLALENMKRFKPVGQKHIVLADMLELGKNSKNEHFEIGRMVRKMNFRNLYTYGAESFHTFEGAKGTKNNFYFRHKDLLSVCLRAMVNNGDLVLVKGSRGMKMEEIVNGLLSKN